MSMRKTYAEAIREATDQCLAHNSAVYLMGLGVPDPKGVFGTTLGLQKKYGEKRVMDMPVSENAMTGVAIGSAIAGMRPIMTHQRVDFMLLSLDQIINNAAKWHYMFGGKMKVPLVIRMIIGQGWGQGPQHSQSLQALFAHIPGLKVVMPATAHDAKGLLIASVEDDNPVIYIEHRWLHNVFGLVPDKMYRVKIGQAQRLSQGKDITIVSSSYMSLEALKAVKILKKDRIGVDLIDLRTIKPLDEKTILKSVKKTGRLLVLDHAWKSFGVSAEIISLVSENAYDSLKAPPLRIALPDIPTPTSRALANHYYPRVIDVVNSAYKMLGLPKKSEEQLGILSDIPLDVPDKSFTGPF